MNAITDVQGSLLGFLDCSISSIVHYKISASTDTVTSVLMSSFSVASIIHNNASASTINIGALVSYFIGSWASASLINVQANFSASTVTVGALASYFIRSWASVILNNVNASLKTVGGSLPLSSRAEPR